MHIKAVKSKLTPTASARQTRKGTSASRSFRVRTRDRSARKTAPSRRTGRHAKDDSTEGSGKEDDEDSDSKEDDDESDDNSNSDGDSDDEETDNDSDSDKESSSSNESSDDEDKEKENALKVLASTLHIYIPHLHIVSMPHI